LTVTLASSTYELNVVYSQTHASLSGTVTDHNGSPSPGAVVLLLPDPPRQERSSLYERGNTDQYGHFSLDGLLPGNYHAVAVQKLDDSVDEQDPDFLTQFGSDAVAVSFCETDKKSVQLTLSSLPKNQ
jgi:Carboxypeptidase regulatory-like domain